MCAAEWPKHKPRFVYKRDYLRSDPAVPRSLSFNSGVAPYTRNRATVPG